MYDIAHSANCVCVRCIYTDSRVRLRILYVFPCVTDIACLMVQMLLRAQPFPDMPYHGKTRTDYVAWRTPYCALGESLDPADPEHLKEVGYGRAILFFKCFIGPPDGSPPRLVELAFIEEFWRYTPAAAHTDRLDEAHGCTLMYRTTPDRTYYVVDVGTIMGPAAITRDPGLLRIPRGALAGKAASNPHAQTNGPNGLGGSELFRLNIWYMMWGSMIAVQKLNYPADPCSVGRTPDEMAHKDELNRKRRKDTPGCAFRNRSRSFLPCPDDPQDPLSP